MTAESRHEVQPRFDPVVHAPVRLRICGLLSGVEALRFGVIRDTLGVSDATCSKHLKVLAEHGYVRLIRRRGAGSGSARPLTWVSLTREGRRALAGHVQALRAIVGDRDPVVGERQGARGQ